MKFVAQKYNSQCFPIALKNCAVYLNKKLNLYEYIRFCGCNKGRALNTEMAVLKSGLPLEKTDKIEDVFEHGGIITIMHPIFNLHSVFCFPKDNKIILVNSWLGSNELPLEKEEIMRWIAKPPNNRMLAIW